MSASKSKSMRPADTTADNYVGADLCKTRELEHVVTCCYLNVETDRSSYIFARVSL